MKSKQQVNTTEGWYECDVDDLPEVINAMEKNPTVPMKTLAMIWNLTKHV